MPLASERCFGGRVATTREMTNESAIEPSIARHTDVNCLELLLLGVTSCPLQDVVLDAQTHIGW